MKFLFFFASLLLAAPVLADEGPTSAPVAQEQEGVVEPMRREPPEDEAETSRVAPARRQRPGQVRRGVAFGAQLGTELLGFTTTSASGGPSLTGFPTLQGGFFLGYKISRVIIGLGFDIARVAQGSSFAGMTPSSADTAILFTPGIQVAIVRTADQRVEMFGELNVGFGHSFHEESPDPGFPQPDSTNFRLQYQVGPGVRFWAHPHFAVSGAAGVQGDFAFFWSDNGPGTTTVKTSTGVTSIFASLQLLGVF
jgi:hypothetical protein